MRLAPVPQSAASATLFAQYRLGPWELGACVAPRPDPRQGACGMRVVDNGRGYADLDGAPFRAYVCGNCATRLLPA